MKRLFNALPVFVLCAVVMAPIATSAQVSAADAAPYVGSWKLNFEGPMGPLEVTLKVTSEGDKVVGEMMGDMLGNAKSTSAAKGPNGLTLKFDLDIMGMQLPGAITLTPDGAKVKATFDLMDGAFSMPGTGAKV
jgi:hypothetical protein